MQKRTGLNSSSHYTSATGWATGIPQLQNTRYRRKFEKRAAGTPDLEHQHKAHPSSSPWSSTLAAKQVNLSLLKWPSAPTHSKCAPEKPSLQDMGRF